MVAGIWQNTWYKGNFVYFFKGRLKLFLLGILPVGIRDFKKKLFQKILRHMLVFRITNVNIKAEHKIICFKISD